MMVYLLGQKVKDACKRNSTRSVLIKGHGVSSRYNNINKPVKNEVCVDRGHYHSVQGQDRTAAEGTRQGQC